MIDIYSYHFIYRKKHADNISRRHELLTTQTRVGKHFFLSHAVLSLRVTLVACVTTFFLEPHFHASPTDPLYYSNRAKMTLRRVQNIC